MSDLLILTNNRLVAEEESLAKVKWTDKLGLAAIFEEALGLVQSGYELISAPLPPNLPLTRAPYRSLVFRKKSKQYDVAGILALEKANERLVILGSSELKDKQAEDAAFIDRELLRRALEEVHQAELGYER